MIEAKQLVPVLPARETAGTIREFTSVIIGAERIRKAITFSRRAVNFFNIEYGSKTTCEPGNICENSGELKPKGVCYNPDC